MKRTITIVLIVIVLVALAAGVYVYELASSRISGPKYASVADMIQQTAADNEAFSAAVQFENQGNYASAIQQLRIALNSSNEAAQTLTIQFHLANDYDNTGDIADEVALLQQIASNSNYLAISRAYATEQLGQVYLAAPAQSANLVFSSAPYTALYVSTSTNQSARNIFQYAASIYVLPVSEYEIAKTYTNGIFNLDLEDATTSAGKAHLATLKQKATAAYQAGSAAYQAVSANPPVPDYSLDAQLQSAVELGQLQELGVTTLGSADQTFTALLADYVSANNTADGSVRLQYAFYLANVYGSARASQITEILAPLSQDPTHRGALIEPYLKAFVGAPASNAKSDLALLATIDAQFKSFLGSLGWTGADLQVDTASSH